MTGPRRKTDLTVEWIGDEAFIYSNESTRAYCLDPVCSKIFSLCDGTRSLEDLASALEDCRLLPQERESAAAESLAVLEENGLLSEGSAIPRRRFLQAASLVVPAVLSVLAPFPAMASSTTCITAAQCSAGGFGCNPCDIQNRTPAICPANAFCMNTYRVLSTTNPVTGVITPVVGSTCASDSLVPLEVPSCENENANSIWDRSCTNARNAVIALHASTPKQQISDYKCCHCP